jgi:ABC-type transport system involved in Fe-S cluster assembly fused permease/ATPase subunit
MYGAKVTDNIKRAALHCYEVKITHPIKNEEKTFVAELPEDMKKELGKRGFSIDKEEVFC